MVCGGEGEKKNIIIMANIIIKPYASTGSASNSHLLLNPMYRLSMSSLELFHSNFLASLFQEDPIAFLKCFGVTTSNYSPQDLILYREYGLGTLNTKELQIFENELKNKKIIVTSEDKKKKHVTDIAVCCVKNGKEIPLLIIENKIKSYPQRKQLLGQAIKIGGLAANCERVILSIFPVQKEIYDRTGFKKVGYCDLVRNIRQFYQPNSGNSFNMYINDYCKMIDELYTCLQDYTHVPNDHTKIKFLFPLYFKELEEISFMDIYRKYQASMFYYEGLNSLGNIYSGSHDMSNKHAIASFTIELDAQLYAGVQIEHNQFRIVFHGETIKNLLKGKTHNVVLPLTITDVWKEWFGNDAKGESRDGLNNDFCSYSDDFVYKYVEIFDPKVLKSTNNGNKPKSNIKIDQIIETGFGKYSNQNTPLSIKNVINYLKNNANAIVSKLP